jgi:hypothetical protein
VICPACRFDANLPVCLVAELVIPVSFPSQNQLGANARGNAGWHYRRLRQDFAAALHAELAKSKVPKAKGKRRVWFKRVYRSGKRPYDWANLVGGGKAIVDVLVTRGLLLNDTPRDLEGIYSQVPGDCDEIHLRFEDVLDAIIGTEGTLT